MGCTLAQRLADMFETKVGSRQLESSVHDPYLYEHRRDDFLCNLALDES